MKKLKINAPLILVLSFFIFLLFTGDQKANTNTVMSNLEVTVLCNGEPLTGESARVHIIPLESLEPVLMESTDPNTGIAYFDVSGLSLGTYSIEAYSPCGNGYEIWVYNGTVLTYQVDVDVY